MDDNDDEVGYVVGSFVLLVILAVAALFAILKSL